MKFGPLKDSASFKSENLINWQANTLFWLEQPLRHIPYILPLTEEILRRVHHAVSRPVVVVDIGCGSAWVLDLILSMDIPFRYFGLDFNSTLVDELRKRKSSESASFLQCDIEQEVPAFLLDGADVVINCFNFFELPKLDVAFANAASMLAPGGKLLVFHIDPITQIITISDSLEEVRMRVQAFEESGEMVAYEKRIEVNGIDTTRTYKGILYTISTYFRLARDNGLAFEDFRELVLAKDGPPQLYQIALWSRVR